VSGAVIAVYLAELKYATGFFVKQAAAHQDVSRIKDVRSF